jgi:uncharacterized protein
MDRVVPARRPRRSVIGHQSWLQLLFLHWTVPADLLRPLVPSPLSLDTFNGACYVGVIPFLVKEARWLFTPRALGLDFLETNVRTYVHLEGKDPGVFFFSLDAASRLAVIGARAGFGLPYFYAKMSSAAEDGIIGYRMRRASGSKPGLQARCRLGEPLGEASAGTLEHFLVERYLLHVLRGKSLWTVQVHHQPYPLQKATLLEFRDELTGAAGIPPAGVPPYAHYASRVDVDIFLPRIRRFP